MYNFILIKIKFYLYWISFTELPTIWKIVTKKTIWKIKSAFQCTLIPIITF